MTTNVSHGMRHATRTPRSITPLRVPSSGTRAFWPSAQASSQPRARGSLRQPLGARVSAMALRAAMAAHETLSRVARRLLPGELLVTHEALGLARTHLLAEAARFELAERLEAGPRTAGDLAAELTLDADKLERVLSALASHGIFERVRGGRYANNHASRALLRSHHSQLWAFVRYFASGSNSKAWTELSSTLADGKNAFEHAMQQSVWEWFAEHPEEARVFDRAMMGLSLRAAPVLAQSYPWREVQTVCDVGGGIGTLLAEVLARHEGLYGILCDAPSVIGSARTYLTMRGVAPRVELRAGDFFQEVPAGADVYVLKHVLHDWDDARCLDILRRCRAGMAAGARLLVAERFLHPEQPDRFGTLSDVQMMVVSGGGRERTRAEYETLLAQAGLSVGRTHMHPFIDWVEAVKS